MVIYWEICWSNARIYGAIMNLLISLGQYKQLQLELELHDDSYSITIQLMIKWLFFINDLSVSWFLK